MKVAVLSDTHIPIRAKLLPEIVIQKFKEVDHIIHAGDITSVELLNLLKEFAPVTAVCGNVDSVQVQSILSNKEIITLDGYRIGITHGHGKTGKTLDRAIRCFENDSVDCIVFGHSHIPYCEVINSILLFNPGSPIDKRRNEFFSFGMIELGAGISDGIRDGIKAEHIFFSTNGKIIKTLHCEKL